MPYHLKNLLQLWQQHYDNDVEGQDWSDEHLQLEQLKQLTMAGALNRAEKTTLEHLTKCSACFRAWAQLCRGEENVCIDTTTPASTMFFGVSAEDDVFGQSGQQHLPSSCKRFMLSVSVPAKTPRMQRLVITTREAQFLGKDVRVRDRNGNLILAGAMREEGIATLWPVDTSPDLSFWTIVVRPHPSNGMN